MKVAVTGHRRFRLKCKEGIVETWLYNKLKELNDKDKITAAYTGMAQGADQLFALQCLKLDIPVYCIFPYERKKYHPDELYIMEHAAGIMSLQSSYSRDSFYKRDKFLVDNCDILLAVWDGIPSGGTYLTVKYAKSINKPIIYIDRRVFK